MLNFLEFRTFVRAGVREFSRYWLNSRQENSVSADIFPPVFIMAGPGTGKTTVLALRAIKLILVDGLPPESIIATTFTRKAATVLRSRILSWGTATILEAMAQAQETGNSQRLAWLSSLDINGVKIGTLDSLAEDILANYRQPGQITPTVIESFVAKGLLKRNVMFVGGRHQNASLQQHLGILNPEFPGVGSFAGKLKACHSFSDRVIHDEIDIAAYAGAGQNHQELANIAQDYYSCLRGRHLIDFAMLEQELLIRLRNNTLTRFTSELRAVLVDEFQDTNYLQEQIYYELCRQSTASLTVVGDDEQ